jgi:hypothetical protein
MLLNSDVAPSQIGWIDGLGSDHARLRVIAVQGLVLSTPAGSRPPFKEPSFKHRDDHNVPFAGKIEGGEVDKFSAGSIEVSKLIENNVIIPYKERSEAQKIAVQKRLVRALISTDDAWAADFVTNPAALFEKRKGKQ